MSKKPKSQKKKKNNCEKCVKTWRVTQLLLFVHYYWKAGEKDGLTFSGEFIWKKFYQGTVNQNLEFQWGKIKTCLSVFVKFMFYKKAIFCFDDSTILIMSRQNWEILSNLCGFLRKHELESTKYQIHAPWAVSGFWFFELIEKVATWNEVSTLAIMFLYALSVLTKKSTHFNWNQMLEMFGSLCLKKV